MNNISLNLNNIALISVSSQCRFLETFEVQCSPSLKRFMYSYWSKLVGGLVHWGNVTGQTFAGFSLAWDASWAIAFVHWIWYLYGAWYCNCSSIYSCVCHVHLKELYRCQYCEKILCKRVVDHYWSYVGVFLSGISWSFSVWSGLKSISSSALMKLVSVSVWKIVLFPLRTLFLSNLWCSQSSEVELTPEQQHVPIIFRWSFVPERFFFFYCENNLWYKTRWQTTIIWHFTYWTRPQISHFDEQQTCFLCPSWWHISF